MTKQIHIIPAKTFEIKKNHKYLLIMPGDYIKDSNSALETGLKSFFGSNKVFVIGARDINNIKIAEVFEE